jgi:NAD(P)H-dependent FMN reductase
MASFLAFAGSNSSTSINYSLVQYTVSLIEDHEIQLLNMVNMPFPIYSEDLEREQGFSNSLIEFKDELQAADGLIISVNEHNGNPSAYTKNLFDWLSRLERKFLDKANILLMSTSGGKRGGAGSLQVIESLLPRFGGKILATFSLPSYNENFSLEEGITDDALAAAHREALNSFLLNF